MVVNCCFSASRTNAQSENAAEYSYDENGNRINCELIILTNKSSQLNTETHTKDSLLSDSFYLNNIDSNGENTGALSQQVNEPQLSVFPNPTYGILNYRITNLASSTNNAFFEVYSESAILLMHSAISEENNRIDLSSFSNGAYYIKFVISNLEKTYKIIK